MVKADIAIRIATEGEDNFRKVGAILRSYGDGKEINQQLRTHLRDMGAPIIAELRAAVMGVVVTSKLGGAGRPHRETGLRARVASAVRMSVAYSGINFTVLGSAVGAYGSTLAKYLDSTLPGYKVWRHPVFGSDRWESQAGQPWFFDTIDAHEEDFAKACMDAIDEVLTQIESRSP